ncbi:uncharacterized protein [Prorops nasuta]|uniref:uncharacterized protein n=1 Tax=Prorops nasuta TaxID=863751 RepID=UPI0034CF3204
MESSFGEFLRKQLFVTRSNGRDNARLVIRSRITRVIGVRRDETRRDLSVSGSGRRYRVWYLRLREVSQKVKGKEVTGEGEGTRYASRYTQVTPPFTRQTTVSRPPTRVYSVYGTPRIRCCLTRAKS